MPLVVQAQYMHARQNLKRQRNRVVEPPTLPKIARLSYRASISPNGLDRAQNLGIFPDAPSA
jgi:hypothetical protein